MDNSVQIAILGSSVVMVGIASALRARAALYVRVVTCTGDLLRLTEQSTPDILIFDLAAVAVDEVRPLLRSHRTLTLIGIDIAGRQALTFSGKSCPLSTLDDLTRLIDLATGPTNSVSSFATQSRR